MAQVIGVRLRKCNAIYGRNGVYVYNVEIADNDPTAYVAEIYQSQCETYWTMAILNRNIELVYRNHFMEKKTAIRFLKKHFDTNEYVAKIQ